MEYIQLRNTDAMVSRVCMGGCPMGQYGWGKVQEPDLIDAVNSAVEHGINFFDTADTYGLGKSEQTLGKALGSKRKDVFIETKFGVRVENGKTWYDNSPGWIEKALEASLHRLKTDYVDIYVIHYRDDVTPIGEVLDALERHRVAGKICYYGISNIHMAEYQELLPYRGKLVCMQDEYSLACRKNEHDLKSLSSELDVTPLTWGSLGQGILTGKYNTKSVFGSDDRRSRDIYVNFHGDKLNRNLMIVEAMRPLAAKYNVSLASIALRFILDFIPGSVTLVGAKRPSQIIDNTLATGWTLTKEELDYLDHVSKESCPEPGKE